MDDIRDLECQLTQLETLLVVAGEEDKVGILALIEDLQTLIKSSSAEDNRDVSRSANHIAVSPISSAPTFLPNPDEEYLRFQVR